jgi:4-amino-4-deoxy-L-arabinose transferase-like glycosyltransferase
MTDGNTVGDRASNTPWLPWLVLAALWLASIQVRPLLDPDEGRYAEIPREMAASGDWVTPRLNGLKYFEKPPLQYWMTAAVYRAVGESTWSSRVWSFALAFGCLPLVFAWTRRLYGERAGRGALLALAVSPYFGIIGHLNLLDSGFTFWLTATVLAFLLAQSSESGSREERRWMLASWLAAALAVLSKGIVVGVLAGCSLIAYSVLERDARPWKRLHLALGIPLFLCVTVPWFVLVSRRNPDFLQFFFIHEHFARYLTTVHQRVEPWWYFIPILVVAVFPWLPPFVRACRSGWTRQDPRFKPLKFLLIYAAVVCVFFSTSGSKLAPYILPAIPALAAVVGAQCSEGPWLLARTAWIGAGLLLLVAAGWGAYCWHRNGTVPPEVMVWSVVAVVAGFVGVLAARRSRGRLPFGRACTVAAAAIVGWQCLMVAYAATPPARTSRDLVAAVRPYVHRMTTLYSVGQFRETILPYLQRMLIVVDYEGELEFGMHAEPGHNAATDEQFVKQWTSSRDAIAFIAPAAWRRYQQRGLPARVIAADSETVAVSRQ